MISGQVGRQIHAGQMLFGIHAEPVPERAVPAPFSDRSVDVSCLRLIHHADAEPVAVSALGVPVMGRLLRRRQMIRGDQIDGFSPEDPHPVQGAAVQQHLGKPGIILQGGEQAPAAALKHGLLRRILPRFGFHAVKDVIQGGDSVLLLSRYEKAGILHAQRFKNMFLQVVSERPAGKYLDHRAEHVDGKAVHPAFAGFKGQRKLADKIADLRCSRQLSVFPGNQTGMPFFFLIPADPGRRGIIPGIGDAAGHRKQLAHGHFTPGGYQLHRSVRLFHGDFGIFEPGQVFAHGIPHLEQPLFIQLHDPRYRDYLGHGCDRKNRAD